MTSPAVGTYRSQRFARSVTFPGCGLFLAVATLYVTAQGVEVVDSGRRRWVDTHWFRGNSYFRIGLEWVKTALQDGWPLISSIRFRANRDAEPVMASQKQHEKRLYRIEFQVLTFQFDSD